MNIFNGKTASLLAIALIIKNGQAQFNGFGGNDWSGFNPGSSSSNGGPGGDSFGGRSGGPQEGERLFGRNHIVAHGVLACLAMVIFFPFGAISVRLIPSKLALYLHVLCQILGYVLFVVAFGIGVWMARQVSFGEFNLISQYHPVIGIVVFSFLSLQPVLGVLHHMFFKRFKKRTVWSHAHMWIGRLIITLGIINGSLGLRFAGNAGVGGEAAYGVVAGVIWLVWVFAAVIAERRRLKESKSPPSYDV